MAKLILKRFQCVVDTNESGAESPYFLTFVGDIGNGKTSLKLTRQGNWENEVDKGETWTVNETVAEGFDLVPNKTLVLSAMVEEDEGLDLGGSGLLNEVNMIRQLLTSKLDGFRASGSTIVTGAIASPMATTFATALKLALSSSNGADDDYMGTRRVSLTGHSGDLPVVSFNAGGGKYRVRYAAA